MQYNFDYNNYVRFAWWNYYQSQAYNAWVKHMESLPTYQPLYSDSVWAYTAQDKWNAALLANAPKTVSTEEINKDLDWGQVAIEQQREKEAAIKAAKAAKKAEKKRERNRLRNQHKKEARRAAKQRDVEYFEHLKELDTYGKRFRGMAFGQGWAREKNSKN